MWRYANRLLRRCYLLQMAGVALALLFNAPACLRCNRSCKNCLLQRQQLLQAKASVSMPFERKKQPTTSPRAAAAAHRRVLAADRARHQPDAEAVPCQRRLLWAVNKRLLVRTSAMHST